MTTLPYVYDDGGRAASGRKGYAGDCVCRSVAIASGRPYDEVYAALSRGNASQRGRTGSKAKSARNGIVTRAKWFKDYMQSLGFQWTPCMGIGTGCRVHLASGELPMTGRLVVAVSRHYTAVIDGVIHDNHDPQRQAGRCVYGYWSAV